MNNKSKKSIKMNNMDGIEYADNMVEEIEDMDEIEEMEDMEDIESNKVPYSLNVENSIRHGSNINSQDILNSIDLSKINQIEKKKRGRPKKTQQMLSTVPKMKLQSGDGIDMEEEEIILHLPITKNELMEINAGLNEYSFNDIVGSNNANGDIMSSVHDTDEYSEKETLRNDGRIKQLGMIIKKLKEENDELKKYLSDITPMYFTEVKFYPVDLQLFEFKSNEGEFKKIIPIHTNICCWWCTYPFECLPTYLPEKYHNGNFHVSGCFCSFNCAGAYNLYLKDDKVWERYSLLKLLYYHVNKNNINSINDIEINIAGPKELLNKFGGPMEIIEFRKNSKILGREYHKLIPPFLPVNYGFEEITNSKTKTSNPNLNNLIYSSLKNDNIIIKRNKPVNNVISKRIDSYVSET